MNSVPERTDRTWRAWHVFAGDPAKLDRILLEAVCPEIEKLRPEGLNEWFFLRYWENGYHLRLRLRDVTDAAFDAVGERLRSAAQQIVAGTDAPAAVTLGNLRDGWHADPGALPLFEPGTTVEIMYEPEYRRYGGLHGLPLNEQLFCVSSDLVANVIQATAENPGRRMHVGLVLTAAAIGSFASTPAQAERFLRTMASNWKTALTDADSDESMIEAMRAQLQTQTGRLYGYLTGSIESAPGFVRQWRDAIDAYSNSVRELAAQGRLASPLTGIPTRNEAETDAALQSMMLSQIHMTNNRLGFTPRYEYQFARLLEAALSDEVARAGSR